MLCDGYLKIHTIYRKTRLLDLALELREQIPSKLLIKMADFRDLQFRPNKKYDKL
jgi:hypothetical protein